MATTTSINAGPAVTNTPNTVPALFQSQQGSLNPGTFASLAPGVSTGQTAYTSDLGLCVWNGTSWAQSSTPANNLYTRGRRVVLVGDSILQRGVSNNGNLSAIKVINANVIQVTQNTHRLSVGNFAMLTWINHPLLNPYRAQCINVVDANNWQFANPGIPVGTVLGSYPGSAGMSSVMTTHGKDEGFFPWINAICGNPFDILADYGANGATSAQVLSWVPYIISAGPQCDEYWFNTGANDVTNTYSITAEQTFANLQAICNLLLATGARVRLFTGTPVGYAVPGFSKANFPQLIQKVHAKCIQYARNTPGVLLYDLNKWMTDTTSAGGVTAFTITAAGTGYGASQTFLNVPITGGSGTGCRAGTITTNGAGAVTSVTIGQSPNAGTQGNGYVNGDSGLSANAFYLGGTGSGLLLSIPASSVTSFASANTAGMEGNWGPDYSWDQLHPAVLGSYQAALGFQTDMSADFLPQPLANNLFSEAASDDSTIFSPGLGGNIIGNSLFVTGTNGLGAGGAPGGFRLLNNYAGGGALTTLTCSVAARTDGRPGNWAAISAACNAGVVGKFSFYPQNGTVGVLQSDPTNMVVPGNWYQMGMEIFIPANQTGILALWMIGDLTFADGTVQTLSVNEQSGDPWPLSFTSPVYLQLITPKFFVGQTLNGPYPSQTPGPQLVVQFGGALATSATINVGRPFWRQVSPAN